MRNRKQCSYCRKVKNLEEFHNHARTFDGNPTFLQYSRSLRSLHDQMTNVQASVLLRLSLHLYMKGDGLIKTDRWASLLAKNTMTVSEMASTVGKSRYGAFAIHHNEANCRKGGRTRRRNILKRKRGAIYFVRLYRNTRK